MFSSSVLILIASGSRNKINLARQHFIVIHPIAFEMQATAQQWATRMVPDLSTEGKNTAFFLQLNMMYCIYLICKQVVHLFILSYRLRETSGEFLSGCWSQSLKT